MKTLLPLLTALSLATTTGVAAAQPTHPPAHAQRLAGDAAGPPTRGADRPSAGHPRDEQPARLCHTSPRACHDATHIGHARLTRDGAR